MSIGYAKENKQVWVSGIYKLENQIKITIIFIKKNQSIRLNLHFQQLYLYKILLSSTIIAILMIKPQCCRYALMLVTYLMMIPYLRVDDSKNQFHYQLASALIVGFQFVIITSGEFIDALVQVLSIFSIYLAYFIIYQPNFSQAFVLSAFLICFLLLFSLYQNVAAERSKFQLIEKNIQLIFTLLNEQWDKILLSMVTEPCVIFNFDQLRHTFIVKGSFSFIVNCDTNEDLKNFLRKSKLTFHKKINLENFLFKQIDKFDKQNDNIINQSLIIELNQKAQEITYSIFSGTNPIILIKIDQCKCSRIVGEQQNLKIEQQFQFKYRVLLKSIYQQFKRILIHKTSNLKGLFKLIIYHYLQEKLEQKQIKQVNLSKVFSNLKLLYSQKQIILSKNLLDFTFLGYKEALFLILIEIFECNISNQIYIQINNDNCNETQFEMLIFGIYNEKSYKILRQRLVKLEDYFNNLYLTQQCKIILQFNNYIFYYNFQIQPQLLLIAPLLGKGEVESQCVNYYEYIINLFNNLFIYFYFLEVNLQNITIFQKLYCSIKTSRSGLFMQYLKQK